MSRLFDGNCGGCLPHDTTSVIVVKKTNVSSALVAVTVSFCFTLYLTLTYVGNADDVGKYSGSCNARACSITFDNERKLVVTFGFDGHDVVTSLQIVERVMLPNGL